MTYHNGENRISFILNGTVISAISWDFYAKQSKEFPQNAAKKKPKNMKDQTGLNSVMQLKYN